MFIKTREYQELFLEALRAGIRGQRVAWKERSVQEWSGVFALADIRKGRIDYGVCCFIWHLWSRLCLPLMQA